MSGFTFNNWVSITALTSKRCQVEIRFGEITQVKNVPNYQTEALASHLIVSVVRRYVNHRFEILHHYGGHLTEEKIACLKKLRLAFHQYRKFPLTDLPGVVKGWSDALFIIRPGRESKYYQRDMALLSDLLSFADYYKNRPLNINQFLAYA